jgi:hypothetical protein
MKRKRGLSVKSILGKGSYGTVYKVEHEGSAYACKLLIHDDEYDLTDYFKTSFREIFFGNFVGLIADRKQMVLGGLLELAHASFGTCTVSENALRGLRDVCIQLDALHKDGIIHHDIKPDNILLYENRQELSDFSLSVRTPVISDTNVYTIWYRAPEILLGMSHTAQADMWALGMTFLQLILNRPVYKDLTEKGALAAIVRIVGTQNYAPLVKQFGHREGLLHKLVSPRVYDFVSALLQVNPGLRLKSKDVLAHPFWNEGPVDPVLFYNSQTETSESCFDYEIYDAPVYFKQVPALVRVRIFDEFVTACATFRVSKRVLSTAYYFWDTIPHSGRPWYAACFFVAMCLECESVPDIRSIWQHFKTCKEFLIRALFTLPTLTRMAPARIFSDEHLYAIVQSPTAWMDSDVEHTPEAILELSKTRATFLLL